MSILSDEELAAIGVASGFGTEVKGYANDVLWFDGNPIPVMRSAIEAYRAKLIAGVEMPPSTFTGVTDLATGRRPRLWQESQLRELAARYEAKIAERDAVLRKARDTLKEKNMAAHLFASIDALAAINELIGEK